MKTSDRPASLDALPNFLVEHDKCQKGFDVDHPAGLGGGVISMTCRTCGGRFEFVPTTVEVEREIQVEPVDSAAAVEIPSKPAPPEPATTKPVQPELRPASAQAPRKRRSSRSKRDRVIVSVLLVFAIAAFAFAIFRVINESGESDEATTPTPAAPGQTATPPAPEPRKPVPAPDRTLQLAGGSISVPSDWSKAASGGQTTIAPAGNAPVSIEFFNSTNPSLGIGGLISGTESFLASEKPNGVVGPVRRTRVAGNPAFELTEGGPKGSQEALGVVSGPSRFLLIGTAKAGASAAQKADLRKALGSFRPN